MVEWRPIPGLVGYEASSTGLVRSVGKVANGGRPHVLAGCKSACGYRQVRVRVNGKPRSVSVHQLIAWAFIGPQAPGMEVNHKDGNKENNAPANLEYMTRAENNLHAFRTGLATNPSGDAAKFLRFRFVEVEVMRALRRRGWQLSAIAEAFGTSKGYVSDVCSGKHRLAA